jgi:hypothetical protein
MEAHESVLDHHPIRGLYACIHTQATQSGILTCRIIFNGLAGNYNAFLAGLGNVKGRPKLTDRIGSVLAAQIPVYISNVQSLYFFVAPFSPIC